MRFIPALAQAAAWIAVVLMALFVFTLGLGLTGYNFSWHIDIIHKEQATQTEPK
jgi:hypothetical protein